MSKLIYVLTFVLTFQSLAFATPEQNLKSVYDDFIYAKTVEWNQQDPIHLQVINDRFREDLIDLQERGALTPEEINSLINKEILTGRVSSSMIDEIFGDQKKIDLNKLSEYLKENGSKIYSSGANWNGGAASVFFITLIGFVPALIIIATVTTSSEEMCSLDTDRYQLGETYSCN